LAFVSIKKGSRHFYNKKNLDHPYDTGNFTQFFEVGAAQKLTGFATLLGSAPSPAHEVN
jgi:hypothetical protein